MHKNLKTALLVLAMVCAVVVPSVEASSISFYDGTNTKIVADGSADDTDARAGWVAYSGSFADSFTFFAETGVTKPAFGSSEEPIMFAFVIAESNNGKQTLEVTFSESDFGPTGLYGLTAASSGGESAGNVTYLVLQNTSNALFTGTPVAGGVLPPGGFLIQDFTLTNGAFPYSLTQVFKIEHDGDQRTEVQGALQVVPDGGSTLALLGLGMVGLGAIRRKFSL